MSDFWARKLGNNSNNVVDVERSNSAQQPWWQAPPAAPVTRMEVQGNAMLPGGVTVEKLSEMDASTLSGEALEIVAQYKLSKDKYNHACPYCNSTNFGGANGTRYADRCFDCGYMSGGVASRGDHQMQPRGHIGGGGKASQHINGGAGTASGGVFTSANQVAQYGRRPGV